MKAYPDRYYTRLGDHVVHEGMDLRDYFAAKAMHSVATLYPDWSDSAVCIAAYRMADAMMEARK